MNGIPQLGDMPTAAKMLAQRAKAHGAAKIVCVGASMGACGAGLYASLMGADLIAFGTELWPNIYAGYSRENLPANLIVDASKLGNPTRALLICGITWLSDAICANHFSKAWKNAEAIYLRNCGHESARFLKDHGILATLLKSFAQGEKATPLLSDIPTLSQSIVDALSPPHPAETNAESLERFALSLQEYLLPGEWLKIGHYLYARKALHPAARFLANFRAKCGEFSEATLLEVMILRKLKRYQDALQMVRRLEKNAVLREQALWYKALLLEQIGEKSGAELTYKTIIDEHSRSAIALGAEERIRTLSSGGTPPLQT
ncbi:tetratricopeptide repeat protein [Caldimonas thermodepolymerans]|uniref:tetratricopeptide repeat protein n=1 Tax=Caldimonas thermodepolymerans TaxID=215580 RepID=UPI0024917393|nr:hypothetical protein [Caldimonas thermodepolymerans]